jgi:hypothetical protein
MSQLSILNSFADFADELTIENNFMIKFKIKQALCHSVGTTSMQSPTFTILCKNAVKLLSAIIIKGFCFCSSL